MFQGLNMPAEAPSQPVGVMGDSWWKGGTLYVVGFRFVVSESVMRLI